METDARTDKESDLIREWKVNSSSRLVKVLIFKVETRWALDWCVGPFFIDVLRIWTSVLSFFLFFLTFFLNSQEAASGKHKSSSKQGTWGSGHLFPAASGCDDPVPELRGVAARENKDVKPQTRRMGGDRLQGGNRKVTPLTRWQILFVLLRFSRISLQGSADLHKSLASKRRAGPMSSWENDPFGGSFPAR